TSLDQEFIEGFTPRKPSLDSRRLYVSNSTGSDANNSCEDIDKPCKSLQYAAGKMRTNSPDHLYLKRGDVWTNESFSNLPAGRSNAEPAVVAFYGCEGDRPKIQGN